MAQLTHGMNLAEVQDLGRFLQAKAGEVEALAAEVENRVRATSWKGSDADTFRDQWWPAHRKVVRSVSETIRGFGQSALNNVAEQRRASQVDGTVAGPGGSGPRHQPGPPAPSAPGHPGTSPSPTAAIPGADDAVARMERLVGSKDYEYWCARTVAQAWGQSHSGYEDAHAQWQAAVAQGIAHPGDHAPPRGALVFYDWTGSVGGVTDNYGHVAISLGDGRIISTSVDGRVGITTLDHFANYDGWTPPPW